MAAFALELLAPKVAGTIEVRFPILYPLFTFESVRCGDYKKIAEEVTKNFSSLISDWNPYAP